MAVVLAAGLLGGCQFITDPSPDPSVTSSTAEPVPEPTTSETEPSPASPTPTPPSPDQLPGSEVTGYPDPGTALNIIGVPSTEILNLRIAPGVDFESIARLTPEANLVATGRNRLLEDDQGLWYEVHGDGELGWVSAQYVAQLGASRNVTDSFNPPPTAATRIELIDAVVAAWDGTANPDATVVYGPVEMEDLQVRIDVLTGGDDSVLGARLFVVADNSSAQYVVTRVTATQLCARGLSGTGDCL